MSKEKFIPEQWLQKPVPPAHTDETLSSNRLPQNSVQEDIETVTQRIESANIDITSGYENWRDLGFALSEELGESGRDYYHRISRFNPDYDQAETDKQYDRCLRAHGTGVTIKTFFQKAKEVGISLVISSKQSTNSTISTKSTKSTYSGKIETISNPNDSTNVDIVDMEDSVDIELPSFSSSVRGKLPQILEKIVDLAVSEQDSDILLLGSLTVMSACLPHISGIYGGKSIYPNLFLFVTANASSGKGRLSLCSHIVEPIHKELRNTNEAEMMDYKQKLAEYNAAGKKKVNMEKPEEPPMRMLFIPANSSATAVYQVLNDNGGKGLMFETEGDTLANTFSSDYGNYSDGFRKAFHHEKISYIRRKDREYVSINTPMLSTLLTGTPRQILNLITDAENGLFSRFIFYQMDLKLVWQNVFDYSSDRTLDDHFKSFGEEFYELYTILSQKSQDSRFGFTIDQEKVFNEVFCRYQEEYFASLGNGFVPTVRRLGVVTFRIAMILSSLRILENGDYDSDLLCSNEDFETAMAIADTVIQHNAYVFSQLPVNESVQIKPRMVRNTKLQVIFDSLPEYFERKTYVALAENMDLNPKSLDRIIKKWCEEGKLENYDHGKYRKI